MAITAAQLSVRVNADTKQAEQGLKGISEKTREASGGMRGMFSNMLSMAGGMMIANGLSNAFGFLTGQLTDCVRVAMDAQTAQSQLTAGLKSTHDASGMTVQGLDDLAESYSKITPFSKLALEQAEGITLSFTNIGKNVFPQATMAAEDLATRMGMDLPNATLMLDKALGNPVQGITALTREGVVFTKQQKEMVKQMVASGNVAGAQNIILKEMQKEFGGSATAAGSTFAGALQIAQNQLEDTKEKIGTAFLPILTQLLKVVTPLAAAIGTALTGALNTLSPILAQAGPLLQTILKGAQGIGQAFMTGLKPAIDAVSGAFSGLMPHGKSAKGMFDGIGKTLHDLQPIAKQFGAALGGVLKNVAPILTQVAGIIGKNLGPFIKLVAEFVVKHLLPALQQFGAFVSKTIMPIVNTLVDVFMKDVMPTVLNLASAFTDKLLPPLENIMSHVLPVLNPLFKFLGWIFSNIIGPVLGFIIGLIGKFLDALSWLIDKVSHVGDAFQKFGDLMRNIWNGVVGGVKGFINMILGWVNDLIGALDSIQVTIPSWVPIFGGTTFGLHIPKIPLLAEGGDITQAGTAIVGERGPELLSLPQGARVTPLSHSTAPTGLPAGMAAYGLASASQGGSDLPVHIFLDGRKVAEVVVKHTPSVVRNSTGTRSF